MGGELGIFPSPSAFIQGATYVKQPIWGESSEFFQVPGHSSREKVTYDDSHLASLGASLYSVPEPVQGVKLENFPSPRAYM